MRKMATLTCAGILSLVAVHNAAAQETLKALTANLIPYTIENSPAEPGFSYEALTEMAKRAGLKIDIEFMPWQRALAVAKDTPNTLLFAAARTPDREPNYFWMVKMLEAEVVFVTTKTPIDSVEQAKSLSVSAVPGSPQEKELKQANVQAIEAVENPQMAAKMLERGRVDAWYTYDLRAAYVWKKNDLSPALVFGKSTRVERFYLAGHKDMSPAIKDRFQAAYDSMVKDGTYGTLFRKYFGEVKRSD
jgi:polar amino acid transport system substrate-binding protein